MLDSLTNVSQGQRSASVLLRGAGALAVFEIASRKLSSALDGLSGIMDKVSTGELTVAEGAQEAGKSCGCGLPP